MKKSIYISGIACANLLMLACLFKVMHWPGAGILLPLSILLFCFVFLPSALINSYREQKKYLALHVITFIVFFICMMGVLFKVQHWPGASIFLLLGIPLPFVLFLPLYLYQTRNLKKNSLNFLGIMFGLTFLAVFSVLLALNVSKEVLNQFSTNMNNNEKAARFNYSNIEKAKASINITNESDKLYLFIEELKCELLEATENSACSDNRKRTGYNPIEIINKEASEIPRQILYGDGKSNNKINELKTRINNYREFLIASGKLTLELSELINTLFDVSNGKTDNPNDENLHTWEHKEFSSYQLIIVLDVLSQIQSNVRLVESEYLAAK